MKKKIITSALCSLLLLSGAITANAVETKNDKSFTDLKNECYIPDNTVTCFTYGIGSDYTANMRYKNGNEETILNFSECLTSPKSLSLNAEIDYDQWLYISSGSGVSGAKYYSFDSTGGRYRKIRIKLSDFSDYFNEDGSHTENLFDSEYFNFNFKPQSDANGKYYNSTLVIKSGAAHNAVSPDENGEVEIYISLNPNHKTETFITYYSPDSSGGGIMGGTLYGATFGDVNASGHIDISDVTSIQLSLAGKTKLDSLGKFHADVNLDGIYNVKDVTALQIALAEK